MRFYSEEEAFEYWIESCYILDTEKGLDEFKLWLKDQYIIEPNMNLQD